MLNVSTRTGAKRSSAAGFPHPCNLSFSYPPATRTRSRLAHDSPAAPGRDLSNFEAQICGRLAAEPSGDRVSPADRSSRLECGPSRFHFAFVAQNSELTSEVRV